MKRCLTLFSVRANIPPFCIDTEPVCIKSRIICTSSPKPEDRTPLLGSRHFSPPKSPLSNSSFHAESVESASRREVALERGVVTCSVRVNYLILPSASPREMHEELLKRMKIVFACVSSPLLAGILGDKNVGTPYPRWSAPPLLSGRVQEK